MNREQPPVKAQPKTLVEPLEPRIAPAALLETKFTSVTVGSSLLLDASGAPGTFQGLTTGVGPFSGSYLLYLQAGTARVFTTDLNGNGILDPGEITGIALGKDSLGHNPNLILFSDVKGDIVTNLQADGNLTDSDRNSNNGRDGRVLLPTDIDNLTLRTLTAADIDTTVPGNTVANRLALTHFSVLGNIISGGNLNGLSIDASGATLLATKFAPGSGPYVYNGAQITIGGLETGTAANDQYYHFTTNAPQVVGGGANGSTELANINTAEGQIVPFQPGAGVNGGGVSNVAAVNAATLFSIGHIDTGAGGAGAHGGDITNVTLHGAASSYEVVAGDGGQGATGGRGGNIIGFSDLGTVTGQSFLHTGSGGRGTLGAGGDGGIATFGTTTNSSDFELSLGAGGAGFTHGGNGAGLTGSTFTAPDVTLPLGNKLIGTWHDIGDIGNTHPSTDPVTGQLTYSPEVLDLDGDGLGDAIFTTTNPSQVVVVFGNGQGDITDPRGDFFSGIPQKTIILEVPGGGTPVVTVGDFNGDGRPDIAAASGNASNFGGVYVYFNQIGNPTLNPTSAANYTHNPLGNHPFSEPLFSPVPTLNNFGLRAQGDAILALAAGDFNGDGITDLAYLQHVTSFAGVEGGITGVLLGDAATALNSNPGRVGAHVATTFVNGSVDNALFNNATGRPQGTGFFYSNAAPTNGFTGVQFGGVGAGAGYLRATSTTVGNVPTAATGGRPLAPESVLAGVQGTGDIFAFTTVSNPVTHQPFAAGLLPVDINLGSVDVNRLPNTPTANNESDQAVALQDFQLADVNQDGIVDLVALTAQPQTFFVNFAGNADGTFGKLTGSGDQSGLDLAGYPTVAAIGIALAVSDPTQTGHFNGFTVESLPVVPTPRVELDEFILTTDNFNGQADAPATTHTGFPGIPIVDRQVNTLDAFYASAPRFDRANNAAPLNAHPAPGYALLAPDISNLDYVGAYFLAPSGPDLLLSGFRFLTNNGFNLYSGDGGSASNGPGGNAGALGDGTLSVGGTGTTIASVSILYTGQRAYEGAGLLHGGNGGAGFGGGGIGGDVAGVSTRVDLGDGGVPFTSLEAGNGGDGVAGDGGRGGGINAVSIQFGPAFFSGNGGNGVNGGTGGSILGNQVAYDTLFNGVTLSTGLGGRGQMNGGAGGTISRWDSNISGFGGDVLYQTGGGGSGAAGAGGAGGGILDSPLDVNQNFLSGSLTLLTGKGGNGLVGGNGGLVTNFTNQPTSQAAIPTTLAVLAGAGGIGVSGAGGTGGTVTNFQSNTIGFDLADPNSVVNGLYNGLARIIAGDGGVSYGGVGGMGGSLTNLNATATSSPLIVAAGQGGEGLTQGGAGGSVSNSLLNSAATLTGKLLVVGGKGGDALAATRQDVFLPGDNDPANLAHAILAFGGVTGLGGNGGSVTNITQPTSTQTAVDIIAGNGGSTPNAGSASTATTTVGQGGSIGGIILTGTLGSIQRDTTLGQAATPPIKSYSATNAATGVTTTSISEFVDYLANSSDAVLASFTLNDNAGNVGMVAGAAGTVRSGQPAMDGINGSVAGVSASSILSIVAGSVDRVAPVATLSGVVLTNPDGVLGADKSPNAPFGPNGALDYGNLQGVNVANLQPGYRLIDGAIFATNLVSTAGQPLVGPRVFPANT